MGIESEVWGDSGAKHRIEYNGKTYEARLLNGVTKTEFEKRLFERAKETARSDRKDLGEEWFVKRLDEINEDYLLGGYDLFSKRGSDYIKSAQGISFLFSILVGCTLDEVMPLALARGPELHALVALIIQESFPGVDFEKLAEDAVAIRKATADRGGAVTAKEIGMALSAPITAKELLETQTGPKP